MLLPVEKLGGEGGGHTLSLSLCVICTTVASWVVGLFQNHPVLTQLDLGGH